MFFVFVLCVICVLICVYLFVCLCESECAYDYMPVCLNVSVGACVSVSLKARGHE